MRACPTTKSDRTNDPKRLVTDDLSNAITILCHIRPFE